MAELSHPRILWLFCPICKSKLELDLEKNVPNRLKDPLQKYSKTYKHLIQDSTTKMYIEHQFDVVITSSGKVLSSTTNPGKVLEYNKPPLQDYTYLKLIPLIDPEFRQCVKAFYKVDDKTLDTLPEDTQKQLPEIVTLAGHELTPITIVEFLQVTDGKPRALVVKVVGVTSRREEKSHIFEGVSQRILIQDVTGYLEVTAYTILPLKIGQVIHIAYIKRYQRDGISKIVLDRRIGQICVLPFPTPNTNVENHTELVPHSITIEHLQPHTYYTLKGILKSYEPLKTYQRKSDQQSYPLLDIVLADSSHQLTVSVKDVLVLQIHTKVQRNELLVLTYCQLFIHKGIVMATTTAYSSLRHIPQTTIILPPNLQVHKLSLRDTTLATLTQTNALGTITGWVTRPQLNHDGKQCLLGLVDPSMSAYVKLSVSWFKALTQALLQDLQPVTLTGVLHSRDYTFHLDESEWKLSPAKTPVAPSFITPSGINTYTGMFCAFGLVEKKFPLQKYKSGEGSFLKIQLKIYYRLFYLLAHTKKDKAMLQSLTEGAVYKIYFVRKSHQQNSHQLESTPFTLFQFYTFPKLSKLSPTIPVSNSFLVSSFAGTTPNTENGLETEKPDL